MWEREVTKFLQLIKLFFVVDCSDYRETAFIYAITSAGATFSVTRACRMGQLSNCGCRKPKRKVAASSQVLPNNLIATQPRNVYPARDNMNNLPNQVFPGENNEFEWGGCSDNIHYGYTISKQLMAKNRGKDGRSMVIEHNNEAGRLVSSAFPRCTKYCFDLPKPFLLVLISTRRSSPPYHDITFKYALQLHTYQPNLIVHAGREGIRDTLQNRAFCGKAVKQLSYNYH